MQMGNGILLFVQKRYVVGGHNNTSTSTISRIWHCSSEEDILQPLKFEESDDSMMFEQCIVTSNFNILITVVKVKLTMAIGDDINWKADVTWNEGSCQVTLVFCNLILIIWEIYKNWRYEAPEGWTAARHQKLTEKLVERDLT